MNGPESVNDFRINLEGYNYCSCTDVVNGNIWLVSELVFGYSKSRGIIIFKAKRNMLILD